MHGSNLLSFSPAPCHSPAGWDSEKKINILSEHMKTIDPDAPFEKVIQPPASANVSDVMQQSMLRIGSQLTSLSCCQLVVTDVLCCGLVVTDGS